MPDHTSLLAQIANVRERAEFLLSTVTDHFHPNSEIALRLAELISKYSSIEADIRTRDTRLSRPRLTQMGINEIAGELSGKLGNVVLLWDGLPSIVRLEKTSVRSRSTSIVN